MKSRLPRRSKLPRRSSSPRRSGLPRRSRVPSRSRPGMASSPGWYVVAALPAVGVLGLAAMCYMGTVPMTGMFLEVAFLCVPILAILAFGFFMPYLLGAKAPPGEGD